MTIKKKIFSQYFREVQSGRKNFELRKDEDNIQPGDEMVLNEWDGNMFTGATITKKVKYVLRNVPEYGLMDGYCIIGF